MLKAFLCLAVVLTAIPSVHAISASAAPGSPDAAAGETPGVTPLSGTPAPPTADEMRARVTTLTRRARAQARRLGLSPASIAEVPADPRRLALREKRLETVLGFLSRRTEVRSAVDERVRPAAPPRGRTLSSRVRRQHSLAVRRSIALGVDRPAPLRLAATGEGRRAQLSHWRSVARWLRARTERVRPEERPLSARLRHYDALTCIASHESNGTWDISTGNGYYGGLQMDRTFQQTYAPDLYRTKGTADNWTRAEQMRTAEKAVATRGFHPWPNTARMCGLI